VVEAQLQIGGVFGEPESGVVETQLQIGGVFGEPESGMVKAQFQIRSVFTYGSLTYQAFVEIASVSRSAAFEPSPTYERRGRGEFNTYMSGTPRYGLDRISRWYGTGSGSDLVLSESAVPETTRSLPLPVPYHFIHILVCRSYSRGSDG
jgi:hypothetical protein